MFLVVLTNDRESYIVGRSKIIFIIKIIIIFLGFP